MGARILDLCDAVVALLPAGAERVYEVSIEAESLATRVVYVFPTTYGYLETLTRKDDQSEYKVSILIAERYTGAGAAPNAWLDERIEWVQDNILDVLDDPRSSEPVDGYVPWQSEVSPVYDIEELVQRKLFLSVVVITYRQFT